MLKVGIPQIGMRAGTLFQRMEIAAQEAARRNGAALWYAGDKNSLNGYLFQDSTGTTPATGTDPVGLILDRSYGSSNLGPELKATSGSWTAEAGATIISVNANTVSFTASTAGDAYQNNFVGVGALTIGNYVKINFTITGLSAGTISVVVGFGGSRTYVGTNGTYEIIWQVAGNTALYVYCSVGTTATVTINTVKQLLGYPALQATAANKPTLELQANGYYGMRFDGVNDSLSGGVRQTDVGNWTTIGAGTITSVAADNAFWSERNSAASNPIIGMIGTTQTNGLARAISRNDAGAVSLSAPASPSLLNTPVVMTGTAGPSDSLQRLFVNGTMVASFARAGGTTTVTSGAIGVTPSAAPFYYTGLISLICVFPTEATDSDRIAIERFAALLSGASYV